MNSYIAFALGAFAGCFVCWLLWDEFQFRWTIKHGLSVGLFSMQPSEVRAEIARAAKASCGVPVHAGNTTSGETPITNVSTSDRQA